MSQARRNAMQEIAGLFRSARVARCLSQEEVAMRAGISTYSYGCLERGTSSSGNTANPTLETLVRISMALGVDLRELPDAPQ